MMLRWRSGMVVLCQRLRLDRVAFAPHRTTRRCGHVSYWHFRRRRA
jgi:hypothetical protein